jgi:hypothetical protein
MILEQEIDRLHNLMGINEKYKPIWGFEKMSDAELINKFKAFDSLTQMIKKDNPLYRYITEKRTHLKNIMFNMLSTNKARKRKHIPLDAYGKAFKIFYTPEEIISTRRAPMASIITPDSPTAWKYWKELKFSDLRAWFDRWDEIQQYFPDEKYEELIKAVEKYT